VHHEQSVPRKHSLPPISYDDIVRSTVIDPDSSERPTRAQEQAAREGFCALDPEEQDLHDRVTAALVAVGPVATGVSVEVNRDQVTLHGHVDNVGVLHILEAATARVAGVATIRDWVVVRPT